MRFSNLFARLSKALSGFCKKNFPIYLFNWFFSIKWLGEVTQIFCYFCLNINKHRLNSVTHQTLSNNYVYLFPSFFACITNNVCCSRVMSSTSTIGVFFKTLKIYLIGLKSPILKNYRNLLRRCTHQGFSNWKSCSDREFLTIFERQLFSCGESLRGPAEM